MPQELAVAGLHAGALVERDASLADPGCEVVTHTLQLAEVEHTRLGSAGGDSTIQLYPGEGLREEPRKLALETADLAPQLRSRKPLVSIDVERSEEVSFEQIRHRPGP